MLNKLRYFRNDYRLALRFYSIKQAAKSTPKYTHTINLPKTKFPSRLSEPKRREVEKSIVEGCFKELYAYQREHNALPEFVLHDGPPYANGDLHMGHAVNKVLKDITLRHHVANKRKVHYKPGWDCHGLPIEHRVLSENANLSPLKIRQKSRLFALTALEKQKKGFQSWGVIGDWAQSDNLYKTTDSKYILNQLHIFLELYNKQLVYRALKPVFWSPSSRTALAEAELEYDSNFVSPSVIVRFKLTKVPNIILNHLNDKDMFALIWTTTPWTLPSNQAVCYNPNLDYSLVQLGRDGSHYLIATGLVDNLKSLTGLDINSILTLPGESLSGICYKHPIYDSQELPFLPANHVQESKGTGLVHTAPAHGPEDFLVSLEHKMPVVCFVDEEGKYTNCAPNFLQGKDVLTEGDELVLKYLDRDVIHSGKITHSYPIDWRTKKPVIIRASEQWFINTEKLKNKAVEEILKVNIYPQIHSEASKKSLITQVQKRPYWCISRQRSWGVPIPVFYDKFTKAVITNERVIDHISNLLRKEGNIDFWWSMEINELIPKDLCRELNLNSDQIERGKDIFDIWFDSGISWFVALDGLKTADLYVEGFDQFTGWFQTSLMTSVALRNSSPYKSIFVHGFTVDDKGYKMSKSLGNVISPDDIIKKYGTDTMRWWVASHGTQHTSITVSDNLFQGCSESLNKIRGTLRYLNGVIGENRDDTPNNTNLQYKSLSYLDRYFLNALYNFIIESQKFYFSYEYNRVTSAILNFVTNQISSIYLHLIKDRLYCGTDAQYQVTQRVLTQCYYVLCKVLWPIVPFLVEESWSYYDKQPFYKSIVGFQDEWNYPQIEATFGAIFSVRQQLYQKAKDVNTWTLNCEIHASDKILDSLKKVHQQIGEVTNKSELCEILQVSSILLLPTEKDLEVNVKEIDNTLCPRCRRFSVVTEDTICNRCDEVLNSKNFKA